MVRPARSPIEERYAVALAASPAADHPKLHPGQLLYSLGVFHTLPRGDFGLSDLEWQQLRTQINTW